MKKSAIRVRSLSSALLCSAALMSFTISTAWGQDAQSGQSSNDATPQDNAQSPPDDDIVVTGTLIRGIAPTGTNVVGLSSDDIVKSGATNTNQLLADVPQISNFFNSTPVLGNLGSAVSVVRPNLRNLPSVGGTTTLVLIDGHRAVSAGVLQTSVDPDVIPPAIIERVEVIADGGSAIYGSDAVGGVINMITRKRFNGFEASGHYGFADDYQTVDVNLTAGTSWNSGSAYLSYSYAHNDAIFGRDRDYVQQTSLNTGSCAPGTVYIGSSFTGTSFANPDRVANTITNCDTTDKASIFPVRTRHSIFAGLTQELSSAVTLDVKGFYTKKKSTGFTDWNGGRSSVICSAAAAAACAGVGGGVSPVYTPVAGDTGIQGVRFSYDGIFDSAQTNDLEEFGVTSTITAELGRGWQARVMANYGWSENIVHTPTIDATAETAAIRAPTSALALNPYNLGATSPAVLASILRDDLGAGKQELINGRAVLDGPVAAIGGGDIRLAAGVEFMRESYRGTSGIIVPGQTQNALTASNARTVWSAFGEVVVPIVGDSNATGGIHSLVLSASGRYDHYSDFGSTFNPKFGLTYAPVEWVSFRGNWGKSFNAPSLADTSGLDTRAQVLQNAALMKPGDPFIPTILRPEVLLAGGFRGLGPQKATTWSIGTDIKPPIVPGLSMSLTYWNIHLKNQIGIIPAFSPAIWSSPAYAPFVYYQPTPAEAAAIIGNLRLDGAPSIASLYANPFLPLYAILDLRRRNLGDLKQDGLDFSVSYSQPTSFGSINASVNGTYMLGRTLRATSVDPFVSDIDNASRFSMKASVGASIGDFKTSVSVNHSGGYDLFPASAATRFPSMNHIDSFTTVDLFFQYDLKGESALVRDLSLTLNVNNLFDQDPPFSNTGSGYANGATIGRLVQFGVRKKF